MANRVRTHFSHVSLLSKGICTMSQEVQFSENGAWTQSQKMKQKHNSQSYKITYKICSFQQQQQKMHSCTWFHPLKKRKDWSELQCLHFALTRKKTYNLMKSLKSPSWKNGKGGGGGARVNPWSSHVTGNNPVTELMQRQEFQFFWRRKLWL